MAAVPFPFMPGFHWEEVCCSLVLYSLWEPQQDSVVEVPHTWMIRRPEGKGNRKRMSQVYQEYLHCKQKLLSAQLHHLFVCGIFTHYPLPHTHTSLHIELLLLLNDQFT